MPTVQPGVAEADKMKLVKLIGDRQPVFGTDLPKYLRPYLLELEKKKVIKATPLGWRLAKSAHVNPYKLRMYKEGRYTFPPPPVSHLKWKEADWIQYIDENGKWLE